LKLLFAADRQFEGTFNDIDAFNALGMIGRGFINLSLSGNS